MMKRVCGTCHWCGERAPKKSARPVGAWLRCELFPRSSYIGLLAGFSEEQREALLDALGKPTAVDWVCAGWEQRDPPSAPPRRTWGL